MGSTSQASIQITPSSVSSQPPALVTSGVSQHQQQHSAINTNHLTHSSTMRLLSCLLLGAALVAADKPAVAPKYEPQAQASQTAPVYTAPQAAPAPSYSAPAPAPAYEAPQAAAPDTYGSPSAEVVASNDEYGVPEAPPVGQDSYGAPQAQPIGGDSYGAPQASPVGNQGYYYYYYPVRENGQAAAAQESDDGLLGSLFGGGLLSALLGKKFVVVIVGLAALLVAIAFGLNLSFGGKRSFDTDALSLLSEYVTEDNMLTMVDFLHKSINKYQ